MKPLFRLREFAWAVVSEVEDWLYPYRVDADEPLWAEKSDTDDDSVVTYMKAQMDANNDRIDRLQSEMLYVCLLYTSPSPRDRTRSRMPSSA